MFEAGGGTEAEECGAYLLAKSGSRLISLSLCVECQRANNLSGRVIRIHNNTEVIFFLSDANREQMKPTLRKHRFGFGINQGEWPASGFG